MPADPRSSTFELMIYISSPQNTFLIINFVLFFWGRAPSCELMIYISFVVRSQRSPFFRFFFFGGGGGCVSFVRLGSWKV